MNWPLIPIKDLCDMAVDCINKTAPTVDHETPYKMIRTTNVKKGFIDIKEVKYTSKEVFEKWTRRSKPKFGDVILTREAPVGEVGRFTHQDCENIFLGQRLFHYRPNPLKLDWNFLAYSLQSESVQARLKSKAFGATVPHVKVGDAESLLIPCPPLEDQKKIGSILSSYDDLISINQRRIELLEEAARRLYREWFVHLRFPGHESVPIKDGIPEGWHSCTLNDVCDSIGGGTPSTKHQEYWNGEITWVTPTDLTRNDCLILTRSEKTITAEGLKNSSTKILPPDTILMTSRASIGFFGLIDEEVCTNQGFISVIPHHDESRMFLLFHLMDRVEELRGVATGATFKELSKKTFRSLPIVFPDSMILSTFNNITYPMMKQVRVIKKQNEFLSQARDLLLPRLMSGKLDVSNIPLPEEVLA